jgi:copper chaperone CopZ
MNASKAGVISAFLASACCIGPLVFIAIGLGTGAAFLGRYHWLFLIGGLALLTWAWTKYLRERTVCDCEHRPMNGGRGALVTLTVATVIVLGFGAVNVSQYVFAGSPPQTQVEAIETGLRRVVIPLEGMTCVTCEIPVRRALNKVPGVQAVRVSAAGQTAEVDYDPQQTTPSALVAAINSTGYRATLPKP